MPDAIFALNNNITAYSLKHLQRLGYDIPGQLIVLGFDDVDWFSFTRPTISVIAQPVEQITEKAFALLVQQFTSSTNAQLNHEVLPVKLIERMSPAYLAKMSVENA
jgi:LacI family transcriptional regulator